jgi:hypothetical protein
MPANPEIGSEVPPTAANGDRCGVAVTDWNDDNIFLARALLDDADTICWGESGSGLAQRRKAMRRFGLLVEDAYPQLDGRGRRWMQSAAAGRRPASVGTLEETATGS